MKKVILGLSLLLLMVSAVSAQSPRIGIGFSGGLQIPVLQEDQKTGTVFEFRVQVRSTPWLIAEPRIAFAKYGAPELDNFDFDIDGSKVTSYGVDVTLGGGLGVVGFRPFFLAGVGFYSISNDDTEIIRENETDFGWSAGLGFTMGFTSKFALDVRGKMHVVSAEGDATRKSLALTGGLNYYLGGE